MGKFFYVRNSSDGIEVPVTDGTYEIALDDVMTDSSTGTFQIMFFNSLGIQVTPTAGTVTPQCAAITYNDDCSWLAPGSGDATIDATKVGEVSTYVMPVFAGPAVRARVILSDVTGADYFVATFWRD